MARLNQTASCAEPLDVFLGHSVEGRVSSGGAIVADPYRRCVSGAPNAGICGRHPFLEIMSVPTISAAPQADSQCKG